MRQDRTIKKEAEPRARVRVKVKDNKAGARAMVHLETLEERHSIGRPYVCTLQSSNASFHGVPLAWIVGLMSI